ncbi:hypothetical protein PPRY_a0458 [Pseudoalteromonas prydzensis ACAM 620]|nr:hypothetical protein [Pseudoalteromonas prydzensis ACAM 620]
MPQHANAILDLIKGFIIVLLVATSDFNYLLGHAWLAATP